MPMPHDPSSDRSQESVFDVDAERLASVYAEAALAAAGDLSAQESLVEELESIGRDILQRAPRIAEVFASELIGEDEKIAMLDRIFSGRASAITLNLLKVMARHKRLGILRDLARTARKLWQMRSGRIPVQLETAADLDHSLQQEILNSFGQAVGTNPVVTTRVNPELIGGFVVRVGDRVYDASVRTQLEHMRHGMINRAVEAIQRRPETFFTSMADGQPQTSA